MGKDKERSTTDRRKDKTGATVNARLRRDRTNSMLHRLRAQAMPHYILAGMAAGGTLAGWVGPAVTTPGTAGVAVAAAGAAGVWMWARRRGRRALLTGLGAACWCGWTTAAGMSWDALAVLAVGGYTAALPWWRRHRLPNPPAQQLPEEIEVDVMDPVHLWQENIACPGGRLPSTYLSGRKQLRTGERYALHLVPGKHDLGDALAALPKLRSGLRLRQEQDLIVEAHPQLDESVVQLTIVRQSTVLTSPTPWPGGEEVYDPDRGTIALGPYTDGEGTAEWLLHRDNRLYGGFLAGSTGSGKSRTLESIALGAAAAGCVIWWGDPQGGASSPFLTKHADLSMLTLDDIGAMLEAARQVKWRRQLENSVYEWEGWTPQQDRRGLLIIIDECHAVMAVDRLRDMCTELAREGGKVGIALVLASQVPTLDAFGGSEALRSNVISGNLLVMRIKAKTAKNILPGVEVDPSRFPRIGGYGWLVDDTGTRRSAPLRSFYLDDDRRAEAGETTTWYELSSQDAAAAGDRYQRRRQLAAEGRAELGRLLAALSSGSRPELEMPAPVPATTPVPVPVPRFPSPPEIRPMESTPTRVAVLDRPTTTPAPPPKAADVVEQLLAEGLTSPKQMVERSGYSDKAVRDALAELVATGRAVKVRHGIYQPADTE